ncbi:lipase [Actinoallomurus purpureus]|uniref:alpha/beta hydrolase family protein n=1 Tax=Actinoallomurus purpureus TaxID=478114 RepID=UPI002093C895|nr:lipase [Actinoallomurus purpureus]MCO6004508.1 lipase [Actinoallomurus purpureus]
MRKTISVAAALAFASAALTNTAHAASTGGTASSTRPAKVRLPPPTGPYAVGATSLHLIDRSRPDPWRPAERRELMVSVFYPASRVTGRRVAPQMAAGDAAGFDTFAGAANYGVDPGTVDWAATRTHAYVGAPAVPGPRPVVLYSPGVADPRTWNTALVEQLASAGYVVVAVDHTYEASAVEFPGHRIARTVLPERLAEAQRDGTLVPLQKQVVAARVADTRFVLDALRALHAGRLPDAEHRRPPRNLARALDLERVGMLGASGGGFTAAQAMYEDSRIRAGVDMDGTLGFGDDPAHLEPSPVAAHGLDRPFLLMGSAGTDGSDHRTESSWRSFWAHGRGWRADLTLAGSRHGSYTDAEALLPQLRGRVSEKTISDDIGTVDPARAIVAERAYVSSFFDRWLRRKDDGLLDGPSPRYPEITFVR